jgi:hypothetical protein
MPPSLSCRGIREKEAGARRMPQQRISGDGEVKYGARMRWIQAFDHRNALPEVNASILHTSEYVSIRQHTSAYVSIR